MNRPYLLAFAYHQGRASCYFCTAPIIVPPGHTSGPLVCEACYRRALAAKEKQAARQVQVHNIPRQAGQPMFAPPIPPQLPRLPASYTTLNLQGPSPGPPPGPPPMIVPSQARPPYPPRYVAGKSRISEPPSRPKYWEIRPPQMDVSKSLDRGSAGTGIGLPLSGESASPGEQQGPSPMNLPHPDQSEPLPKAEEPDFDLDDLDGLELAYPEDDEVASQSETVPAVAEAQSLSPPLPPPPDLHQDVSMYELQPQHEESTSSTGPRSVFDLPDGWDSEISDLTDLSDIDSGESEIDTDDPPSKRRRTDSGLKICIKIPPGYMRKLSERKQRPCVIKGCERMLDPGYKWKLCEPCRTKFREYSRKRVNIQTPRTYLDGVPNSTNADGQTMPDTSGEIPDAALSNDRRLCTIRHCRLPLPPAETYKYRMCEPCRIRSRFTSKKHRAMWYLFGDPNENGQKPIGGLSHYIIHEYEKQQAERLHYEDKQSRSRKPMFVDKHASAVPANVQVASRPRTAFQHLGELLQTLRAYLASFLHALAEHTRIKMKLNTPPTSMEPVLFIFNGEYSIVTEADLENNATLVDVVAMKRCIEEALGLSFKIMGTPIRQGHELLLRFTCLHTFALPMSGPIHPQQAAVSTNFDKEQPISRSVTARSSALAQGEIAHAGPSAAPPDGVPSLDLQTGSFPARAPASAIKAEPSSSGHPLPAVSSFLPSAPPAKPVIALRNMAGEVEIRVSMDKRHPMLSGQRRIVRFRLVG
ncbi:hypothetical protein EWM64_g7866 [Hericium alpestre]|uniref:Uncharacterized protein n=1 Tax=Hericium alpestre TaxID=135208 RepID=A0A4Y9ZNF4_9AGAM|nr:hypothetical protein EWM64_g7866 [Hericium alpestre]